MDQTTSFTPVGQSAISANYAGSDQTERTQFGSTTDASNALGLYSDGTGTFIRDSQGQLVADQIAGSTYYYLLDGLGSVVGLTNGTGTQVASYQDDSYGNPTSSRGIIMTPVFAFLGSEARAFVNSVGGSQVPLWLGIIIVIVAAIVITQARRR